MLKSSGLSISFKKFCDRYRNSGRKKGLIFANKTEVKNLVNVLKRELKKIN